MIKFQKINIIILLTIVSWFLFVSSTQAVNLYLDSDSEQLRKNDQFEVNLIIDTEGKSINAIETEIIYPIDLLKVIRINETNSIISLWIEKPEDKKGIVSFSGVIPSGFDGILKPLSRKKHPGKIITLIFESINSGVGSISFRDVNVLLNDGLGSPLTVSTKLFSFEISSYIGDKKIIVVKDNNPPEGFSPEISRDDSIFAGKYFLSFYTQDKNSGISYYKVKEGNRDFEIAESPYLLSNQKLDDEIIIQAIDKAGNIREERLEAINKKQTFFGGEFYLWFIIVVIILLVPLLVLWKNKKTK